MAAAVMGSGMNLVLSILCGLTDTSSSVALLDPFYGVYNSIEPVNKHGHI